MLYERSRWGIDTDVYLLTRQLYLHDLQVSQTAYPKLNLYYLHSTFSPMGGRSRERGSSLPLYLKLMVPVAQLIFPAKTIGIIADQSVLPTTTFTL